MADLIDPLLFVRSHMGEIGPALFIGVVLYFALQITIWETIGRRRQRAGDRLLPGWLGDWRGLAIIYGERSLAHAGPVTRPLLMFTRWYCVLLFAAFLLVFIAEVAGVPGLEAIDFGPTDIERAAG